MNAIGSILLEKDMIINPPRWEGRDYNGPVTKPAGPPNVDNKTSNVDNKTSNVDNKTSNGDNKSSNVYDFPWTGSEYNGGRDYIPPEWEGGDYNQPNGRNPFFHSL